MQGGWVEKNKQRGDATRSPLFNVHPSGFSHRRCHPIDRLVVQSPIADPNPSESIQMRDRYPEIELTYHHPSAVDSCHSVMPQSYHESADDSCHITE